MTTNTETVMLSKIDINAMELNVFFQPFQKFCDIFIYFPGEGKRAFWKSCTNKLFSEGVSFQIEGFWRNQVTSMHAFRLKCRELNSFC